MYVHEICMILRFGGRTNRRLDDRRPARTIDVKTRFEIRKERELQGERNETYHAGQPGAEAHTSVPSFMIFED